MTTREHARKIAREHAPLNFFYKGFNFQIVGTHNHSNGSCSHDIKNLDIVDPMKDKYAVIADKDLQRILKIARN